MNTMPTPVADPGFPRGGGTNPKGGGAPTYYLAIFSRKLHENEEILGRGGASLAPLLRSTTASHCIVCYASVEIFENWLLRHIHFCNFTCERNPNEVYLYTISYFELKMLTRCKYS